MTLVSIIIGTYNGSKYIEKQLQSIVDQTYTNIEIIVVDDASQDNTVALIEAMSKKYPIISVNAFKENLGYIKNFERGMALANGNLIALSDQDDWWHETKMEKLAKKIGDYDIIYCDSAFTNENLEPTGDSFSKRKNMLSSKNPMNFLIENCASGHAMLIKKSLFDKAIPFPKTVPHDWWLAYLATLNNGINYFNEALVKYRHHDNNVIAENTTKKSKIEKRTERRTRLKEFYNAALKNNHPLTNKIYEFHKNYDSHSYSILNSLKRVWLFKQHKNDILAILKKSSLKKNIFYLNMFFKLK